MTGTSPISAVPAASRSAQTDGISNDRSNRSFCGPCCRPHTNGQVFKKLTAQTFRRFNSQYAIERGPSFPPPQFHRIWRVVPNPTIGAKEMERSGLNELLDSESCYFRES